MSVKHTLHRSIFAVALSSVSLVAVASEVNVYSLRQPFLIEPMMDKFTDQTGIKVNILFAKSGFFVSITYFKSEPL